MTPYQDFETVNVDGKRIYLIDDDRWYPSITTVLGGSLPAEKSSILDAWRARVGHAQADKVSRDAATRGTNVHLMLERLLKNEDPQFSTFPEGHVNIVRSLRLELKKINNIYGQEVVLYSDLLKVAGRCDLVAEHQGELAIVDYKTSSRVKSANEIEDYWLQAAFYALAHNEMRQTNISKLVILMGVENKLPLVFKKMIDEELLVNLFTRVEEFYKKV